MSDSRLHSFFTSTKNTVLRFIPPPRHKSRPHPGGHVSSITRHPAPQAPQRCTPPAVTSAAHVQQSHIQTLVPDTSTVQDIFPTIAPNVSALTCLEEPPRQKVSGSQLPEHIEHADLTDILNDAHNKRTARSIRRQIAAHRVRQCEGNLQILREALQHADRDLAEVNSTIGALQDLFQHTSPAPTTSVEGLHTQHVGTFYDSGASDGSISTRSEASFSGAAG